MAFGLGHVDQASDIARRGIDPIDGAVVRLGDVERVVEHSHRICALIRLEVGRVGRCHRVGMDPGAQIGDLLCGAVGKNPEDAVRLVRVPMGAATAGDQSIEMVAHEVHIGDAADETAGIRGGLVRSQALGEGGGFAAGVDSRDAGRVATGVGADRRYDLLALALGRGSAALAALGEVDRAIGLNLNPRGFSSPSAKVETLLEGAGRAGGEAAGLASCAAIRPSGKRMPAAIVTAPVPPSN